MKCISLNFHYNTYFLDINNSYVYLNNLLKKKKKRNSLRYIFKHGQLLTHSHLPTKIHVISNAVFADS